MPSRSAHTLWTGGLQDGHGDVSLTSSGAGSYAVSFPRRAADEAEGVTSPEELIAAAHSSCFAMQFSALIAAAGATPGRKTPCIPKPTACRSGSPRSNWTCS